MPEKIDGKPKKKTRNAGQRMREQITGFTVNENKEPNPRQKHLERLKGNLDVPQYTKAQIEARARKRKRKQK